MMAIDVQDCSSAGLFHSQIRSTT